ncbi:hypothetical protein [Streptomyces cyaneus]|uniref:hypothetical protein n=1 Tax=Streptomyces cyaneus TaxID=1904 RepID=UPI001FE59EF8|nr:hypothetical protein [Streptomyces cyaneus]
MHSMLSWENGDYDLADYGQLCRTGGELVVFVTEPCVAKAHGPAFQYYREGRLITGFSFEDPSEERIARAIATFFSLPELDMP